MLLLAGGGCWWWQARHWVATDDAFLEAHATRMAPQVGGRVARLPVDDNQRVAAGERLVEIDPRDLQVALESAPARQGSAAATQTQTQAEVAVRHAPAQQRFGAGLGNLLEVPDAERTRLAVEQAAVEAATQVSTEPVALYQAPGGGWERTPWVLPAAPGLSRCRAA